MAFWGVELKPGKSVTHSFNKEQGRLHISQATLSSGSTNKKCIVQCKVGEKEPIYLCSLLPEKLETCPLNIQFEEEEDVTFSVIGSHSVHLCGFFYRESEDYCEDEYGSDPYEEGAVETDSESDDSFDFNFDTVDEDEDCSTDDDICMYPPRPLRKSGVKIEEILEDEKPIVENGTSKRPKKKKKQSNGTDDTENSEHQIVVKGNTDSTLLESEDEDGFPISAPPERKAKSVRSKLKSDGNKDQDTRQEVGVRYIGKLKKNGKIFDSNIGRKPFEFRLGIGQVIKGWDVGVNGMHVGDKRRITIPPAMGYGSKAAGEIPPNSWLVFDVELVSVG
ncbi:unnamed protein product [Withania somnifera]